MAELVAPTVRVHRSFVAAMAEFVAEGRLDDGTMVGYELGRFSDSWEKAEGFAEYVQWVLDQSAEDSARSASFVPATTLWLVEADEYLGRVGIRHRLNADLLERGGHIGYDVRASARRRGYATQMLREALPLAHALGIDPALVTCDVTNIASRKVIEHNGGVLEDQRGEKLRYWVPTGSPMIGLVRLCPLALARDALASPDAAGARVVAVPVEAGSAHVAVGEILRVELGPGQPLDRRRLVPRRSARRRPCSATGRSSSIPSATSRGAVAGPAGRSPRGARAPRRSCSVTATARDSTTARPNPIAAPPSRCSSP